MLNHYLTLVWRGTAIRDLSSPTETSLNFINLTAQPININQVIFPSEISSKTRGRSVAMGTQVI